MRKLVRRYALAIQILLTFLASIATGLYVNVVSKRLAEDGLMIAVKEAGWTNIVIAAAIAFVYAQYRLLIMTKLSQDERYRIISHILQAAVRALALPRDPELANLRAFCHLADTKAKVLRPICQWSPHYAADCGALIPYEGPKASVFVVAQAFTKKKIIAQNLPEDHLQKTPEELRDTIDPNLKSVIAAPIWDYLDTNQQPVGTISFDSSRTLSQAKLSKQDTKDIAKLVAMSVHLILRD